MMPLPHMSSHPQMYTAIPSSLSVSHSHHTTAAPSPLVLIIQLQEVWWTDTVTPVGDWQQTLTEGSGDELTAQRVRLPTLISWSGMKPNWENTTVPARLLRVSQHGGLKEKLCFACVCVSPASENIMTSKSPLTFMQHLPAGQKVPEPAPLPCDRNPVWPCAGWSVEAP